LRPAAEENARSARADQQAHPGPQCPREATGHQVTGQVPKDLQFSLQNYGFKRAAFETSRRAVRIPRPLLALFVCTDQWPRKGTTLSPEPHYDQDSDTYRHIYRSHPSASAVTNTDGITVFFDPDTNQVLGFQITGFAEYYKNHQTPEGEFEIVLPARVPVNLEEEMNFDAESITSGVRIAEIY
jgi:hypothetical protein